MSVMDLNDGARICAMESRSKWMTNTLSIGSKEILYKGPDEETDVLTHPKAVEPLGQCSFGGLTSSVSSCPFMGDYYNPQLVFVVFV